MGVSLVVADIVNCDKVFGDQLKRSILWGEGSKIAKCFLLTKPVAINTAEPDAAAQ